MSSSDEAQEVVEKKFAVSMVKVSSQCDFCGAFFVAFVDAMDKSHRTTHRGD